MRPGGIGITEHLNQLHVYTGRISRGIPFDSFVCTTCGYFENYLRDANKLADVARTWAPVARVG